MIQKLLLVEDDAALCRILSIALGDEGFTVATAATGLEGLRRFEAAPPDLVILDVLLPEMDGLELCRRLRSRFVTPILLLTSRSDEVDRVTGLDLGADDYLTKPFSTRELCARIRAIDRRLNRRFDGERLAAAPAVEPPLVAGSLQVDRARWSALWQGRQVALTRSEFQILYALASNRGLVLARERLLDLARGGDVVVTERTVDAFIRRIRKKFTQADAAFDAIETVFGVGYRYRS